MAAPLLRRGGATTSASKTGCSLVQEGCSSLPRRGAAPLCRVSHLQKGATLIPHYYTDNQNLRRYVCTTSTCNGAGSKIPAGAGQQLNSGPFRGRAGRGLHAWYSPISESQRLYKFCQIVSSESFSNKTMMHR